MCDGYDGGEVKVDGSLWSCTRDGQNEERYTIHFIENIHPLLTLNCTQNAIKRVRLNVVYARTM